MQYRSELKDFLHKQFIFEATLEKNGVMIFNKPVLGKLNIDTSLYSAVTRLYQGDYYKIPVFSINKTTLLKNIKINDIIIDHVWVPYNLLGDKPNGTRKQYIGELYTYERCDGTLDYGIKILGVPAY